MASLVAVVEEKEPRVSRGLVPQDIRVVPDQMVVAVQHHLGAAEVTEGPQTTMVSLLYRLAMVQAAVVQVARLPGLELLLPEVTVLRDTYLSSGLRNGTS